VRIDPTAPVSTLSSDAVLNTAGWSTRAVNVTLSATDTDGSGVKSMTRRVNGTAITAAGANSAVTLSAQGTNTLSYAATDNADNVEGTKSYSVKVDTVAPVTTATSTPAPNTAGWHNTSPVTLTLSPTDATSGVASLRWRVGTSGTWTTAASWPLQVPYSVASGSTDSYTVQYQATDIAGNLEAVQTYTLKIDRSAPAAPTELALSDDTGASTTDAITSTAVQSLNGTAEPGSSLEVRVDGTLVNTGTVDATGTFTVPIGILTAGTHGVTATAVDPAGNRSATAASLTVRLDQTVPTGVITFPGATSYKAADLRRGCGTTNDHDLCGTAADPTSAFSSGLTSVRLELRRGTTCLTGTGTFAAECATGLTATGTASWAYTTPLLTAGSYILTVWATDLAGNTSQVSVAFARD
jgi:hypothetical protein